MGNRGTTTKYRREQANINHFRDIKTETHKAGSNFGNDGKQANFEREKGPHGRSSNLCLVYERSGFTKI